jgi:hypothetical protein
LLGTWRRTSLNGIPTAEGEIVALELLPEDPEVARKLEGIGTLLRSTLIEGPGEDSRFGVTRDMVLVNGDGSSGHFDIPFMGLLALALGTTDRPPSVKPGIYRVEGDTLTILRSTLDSIRPARFDEPLRPGMRLETFERSSEPLPTPQPGEGAGAVPDPGPNADPPSPPPSGSAASPATHPASKPEDSDSIAPILGTWRRSSMNHIPTPEGMVAMLDIRRADPAKISGTGTPVLCTGFAGPLPGGGFLNSQSLALVLGDGQSGHFDFLSLSVFGLPGDFVPKEPANPAIYRIEGDTLTLFSGPSRPTRFDQELTPDMKLEVYERTTDPLPTPASTQAPGHSYGLAPGAVPGDGKAGDVATTPDSDSEQSSPAATGPGNSAAKPPATPDLATLERYREELEVRRAQLVDQAAGLRPELELLGIEQEALATSLRDLLSELQAMERAIKSIDDPLPENRDRLNRLSHETHDLRLEYLQLSRELEEKRLQARSLDSKLDQLDDLRAKVDRALSPVPDRADSRLDEIEAKLDRLTRLIESLADEGD